MSKNAATLLTTVSAAAQEFSDVNLNTSETYYYRLKAKDTDGLLSDYSSEVSATEFKIEDPTNNWYVDRDASGSGDGTSWANAATSIPDLPWRAMYGGDTVYISGGLTSKTYDKVDIINKKVGGDGYLIITKSIDAGYNGEVIFSAQDTITTPALNSFRIYNTDNISLENITIKWEQETFRLYGGFCAFYIVDSDNCRVKNCTIYSDGHACGFHAGITTNIQFLNNTVIIDTNNYRIDQDAIQISNGNGGHTISGNTVISNGTHPTPHKDLMQWWQEGGENRTSIIANNFLIYDSPGAKAAGGMAIEDNYSGHFLIYNNIIALRTAGTDGITFSVLNASTNNHT